MTIPKLITELVGTFGLMLTVLLAVTAAPSLFPFAPVAIGAALVALVYMGGPISQAHYNPAVTLAVFLCRQISLPGAIGYILIQLAGAAAACLLFSALGRPAWAPTPATDVPALAPWLIEITLTTFLILVILNVAISPKTKGNEFYGVAIGLCVTGIAYAGGPISGGAFNPAVGVVPNLLLKGVTTHLPLYTLGPGIGAVLAVLIFKLQHPAKA